MQPGTKVVFKYQWPLPAAEASFEMPRDAEIIHVAAQGDDKLCLWARVVIGRSPETRQFVLCGTGHDAPDFEHAHVGSAILHSGALVLHVFEKMREEAGHA